MLAIRLARVGAKKKPWYRVVVINKRNARDGKNIDIEVKPQELQLAQQLVESLATAFDPSKYHDQYQARLQEMIEAKRTGQETAETEGPRLAPVIDLMEALQKSLKETPAKKAPKRATEAAASTSKKPRATKKKARKAS